MTRPVPLVDLAAVALAAVGLAACCRSSRQSAPEPAPGEVDEEPRTPGDAGAPRAPEPPRQPGPRREEAAVSLRPGRVEGIDDGLFLAVGHNDRTCIVRRRGSVSCFGGTFAACTESPEEGPDEVFLDGIVEVATGYGHTCGRARGGQVHCWGCNFAGQLGLTDPVEGHLPAVPALRGLVEVAVAQAGSCALSRSGRVTCWGCLGDCDGETVLPDEGLPPRRVEGLAARRLFASPDGRLHAVTSDGRIVVLEAREAPDRPAFAAGEELRVPGVEVVEARGDLRRGCARADDGAVYCWRDGAPRRMEGLGAATALALGEEHACALLGGGTVSCWGSNDHGQIGDGTTEDSPSPRPVAELDEVTAIAAGAFHTCALRRSGQTFCWGRTDGRSLRYPRRGGDGAKKLTSPLSSWGAPLPDRLARRRSPGAAQG